MMTDLQDQQTIAGPVVKGPPVAGSEQVLTEDALLFLTRLHQQFNQTRLQLLEQRVIAQQQIDAGQLPGFLPETAHIREGKWTIAPVPSDLRDRRVEITGPPERKMIINALNSGARTFMADFEDSNTPTWQNLIEGQQNLRDAIERTISYQDPISGKQYALKEKTAVLLVRPRGWHMEEKHVTADGVAMSASLFDFGLYVFHNARTLINNGTGPYFYLPKMEHYLEARLWNQVFDFSEDFLGIARGTIKATVLVETIQAAFQMHEILWELQDHAAGLNCGRWDYIFSFIKKFRNVPGYIFPERAQITMTAPCMRAYTRLLIKTCHSRGAHAIGGMAAQIPVRHDEAANQAAMQKVQADKLREVQDGHDGTWVAHPGLVPIATAIFDEHMSGPNQVFRQLQDLQVSESDLLQLPEGTITEAGLRLNLNVGILYIESWLRGNGAAAIYHMMEDAATAEISRTQVWQWLQSGARLNDHRVITPELVDELIRDEVRSIRELVGPETYSNGRFNNAIRLFRNLVASDVCADFLTTDAYTLID